MTKIFKDGGRMRNKIILGLLSLLLSCPAFAGVLIYNLRVYDSSADPTAIIPKYYVADTFAELPAGLQGDYAYAKDTDKFYYYTGAAWTLLSDLSAEPFVTSAASGNLSAERVLTAGTNTTIDTGTAGQIKTNVTASGSDTQIQFNDGGVLGGDSGLVWDKTNNLMAIGGFGTISTAGIALRKDTNAGYTITIDDRDTGTAAHTAFQALSDTGANGNNVALRSHADARTTTQCGAALGGMNDLISVAGAGFSLCSLGTQPIYFAAGNSRRAGILGSNGLFFLADSGSKPTCDSAAAGGFWFDAGTPDTFEVCTKDPASSYSWRSLIDRPTITRLSADAASGSASFADVTGMTFSVAANTTYQVVCKLSYIAAASTTALQLALNGPAAPTAMNYGVTTHTGSTTIHNAVQTAYDTVTNPGTSGGATAQSAYLSGTVENGANSGTLALRFRTEVALSTVTLQRGSFCTWY